MHPRRRHDEMGAPEHPSAGASESKCDMGGLPGVSPIQTRRKTATGLGSEEMIRAGTEEVMRGCYLNEKESKTQEAAGVVKGT